MNQSNLVSWERQGEFGILSLSNGKENYLNTPDFVSLEQIKKWTSDGDLKGVIIRGVGRNFSAGANLTNLKNVAEDEHLLANTLNKGKVVLDFIEDLNVPVIAAINGVCFGGGLEIALACHIRIAAENALFAFPETNLGLIPGLGGTYRLAQLLGSKVFNVVLGADMINARLALDMGIVDDVANTKDAFDFAKQKLENMTSDRSVEVIRYAMQAIHNAKKLNRKDALKKETELFCKLAVNIKFHQVD